MINNVTIVGRLTRDPELRKTGTGKSVLNFTVAANRRFGDKDQADFINCVAWNQTADFMANYLKKGALVGVIGRLQSGSYEDNGKNIYTLDVVAEQVQALESRSSRENNQNNNGYEEYAKKNQYNQRSYTKTTKQEEDKTLDIASDDLPF